MARGAPVATVGPVPERGGDPFAAGLPGPKRRWLPRQPEAPADRAWAPRGADRRDRMIATTPTANDAATEMADTVAAVERFNAAFAQHDVAAIMGAMTEDCLFENTSPA